MVLPLVVLALLLHLIVLLWLKVLPQASVTLAVLILFLYFYCWPWYQPTSHILQAFRGLYSFYSTFPLVSEPAVFVQLLQYFYHWSPKQQYLYNSTFTNYLTTRCALFIYNWHRHMLGFETFLEIWTFSLLVVVY